MNVKELRLKYQHPIGDWSVGDGLEVKEDAPLILWPTHTLMGWTYFKYKVAYCYDPYGPCVLTKVTKRFESGYEKTWVKTDVPQWFPDTPEGEADCKQYISEYLNCAPCRGCKYDSFGAKFTCKECANVKVEVAENGIDKRLYCNKSGYKTYVGDYYISQTGCMEYCKYFVPKPQYAGIIKEWGSWETQDDYLRNCEFNPNCPLHSMGGKNATCTYDRYMNKYIRYAIEPIQINSDIKVTNILIKRQQWIEQNFDVAYGVIYVIDRTKRNPKYNHGYMFDKPFPFSEVINGNFAKDIPFVEKVNEMTSRA